MKPPSRYNRTAIVTRKLLILSLFATLTAHPQQAAVLLDAAQGGSQTGARIADRIEEKQVTLQAAERLGSLLRARGFTVAMTREGDVDVTNDGRAALANATHPIACILLHATSAGRGVHLYTTALHQQNIGTGSAVRWDEAQAAYAERSRVLGEDLKSAFQRSRIAASTGQTWMRPLDNMQCPAVAVEIAPMKDGTGADDTTYQGQIASAVANTLLLWRGKVQSLAPPESAPAPAPVAKPAVPTPAIDSAPKPVPRATPAQKPAMPPPDAAVPARTEP